MSLRLTDESTVWGIRPQQKKSRNFNKLRDFCCPGGEWVSAITLPEEIYDPLGGAILAEGIAMGFLKEV